MRLPRAIKNRTFEQVVVTLKTGETFSGLLYEADGGAIVLTKSSAIGAGENRSDVPLDGELLILLPDVAYIQKP